MDAIPHTSRLAVYRGVVCTQDIADSCVFNGVLFKNCMKRLVLDGANIDRIEEVVCLRLLRKKETARLLAMSRL